LPFSPLGTLGAVINMPAPPRNRRHLLAIGVAGPLAGFVVALPILWIGLHGSPVVQSLPQYSQEGNSLIYALFKFLTFGRFLPGGGQDVLVSQMAFAGWAGLLVTAFNLMPAGQLDGGHIVYALVGPRWSERILWVVLIGMALLSFLWIWWLLWVALSYLVSRLPQALLDDVTEITPSERILAVLALVVFVLVFIPIPFVAGQP
jgi:membrane-associated protease RseP (regulator of RpoE activity)